MDCGTTKCLIESVAQILGSIAILLRDRKRHLSRRCPENLGITLCYEDNSFWRWVHAAAGKVKRP